MKEPSFFRLRQIISCYNGLAAAEPKQQAALVRAIFRVLFGWRRHWLLLRLKPTELAEFLRQLPTGLGLEAKAQNGAPPPAPDIDPWGDIYAHLAMSFGWTYDDIDHRMTLSKLKALRPYLQAHPPTHLLVAAYLDYQPPMPLAEKRRRFFERFTGG